MCILRRLCLFQEASVGGAGSKEAHCRVGPGRSPESLWPVLFELRPESWRACPVHTFCTFYLLFLESRPVGEAVTCLHQWKISRTQTSPVISCDTFVIVLSENEELEKGERVHS